MYEQPGIDVRSDGTVRIVTLNQPDTLNAFTEDLHEQFVSLWADIEADEACRAVVLGIDPPEELALVDDRKVFGLIIQPDILMRIRQARLKHLGMSNESDYGKRGHIEPVAVSAAPGKVTMRLPYDSKNEQQFGRASTRWSAPTSPRCRSSPARSARLAAARLEASMPTPSLR